VKINQEKTHLQVNTINIYIIHRI